MIEIQPVFSTFCHHGMMAVFPMNWNRE